MRRREVPVVLLLDLSPRAMEEAEVVARIPGRPLKVKVLRASRHIKVSRADGSPETPAEWTACARGVIELAREVSAATAKIARAGDAARLWTAGTAGTAGLPVLFHLGVRPRVYLRARAADRRAGDISSVAPPLGHHL